MSIISLDAQLDLIESQFELVAGSLVEGSPGSLQTNSLVLQRLAVELLQMADGLDRMQSNSLSSVRRVKALAVGIATVRENLLRQSAYVDRALAVVVPATNEKPTYCGSGTYGQPGRQSGGFKVLAA